MQQVQKRYPVYKLYTLELEWGLEYSVTCMLREELTIYGFYAKHEPLLGRNDIPMSNSYPHRIVEFLKFLNRED